MVKLQSPRGYIPKSHKQSGFSWLGLKVAIATMPSSLFARKHNMSEPYLHLERLLRDNLLLNPDEYALSQTQARGLQCHYHGMDLSSAFQPIFNADNQIVGREALLRATAADIHALTPSEAFAETIKTDHAIQFDRLLRIIHLLNHAQHFSAHELLFLNVHPHLLSSIRDHGHTFEQILHHYSVPTSQVVIEIKEGAVEDETRLTEAVNNYRNLGYRIALDDFGMSQSNINRILNSQRHHDSMLPNKGFAELDRALALRPDIVKLDRAVIQAAEKTSTVAIVVYGLVNILHNAGVQVAIEGIETAKQLEIARRTGADLLQGFYLGKPEFAAKTRISA